MHTDMGTTRLADTATCGDCAGNLDHCHGGVVTHRDGARECTDQNCGDVDPARHALVLDCVELAACACVAVELEEFAAVS